MTIHLPQVIEAALLEEAAASGLTLEELMVGLLQRHQRENVSASHHANDTFVTAEVMEARHAAVARILALRSHMNSTFGPAPEQGLREWIHEGHRYYARLRHLPRDLAL